MSTLVITVSQLNRYAHAVISESGKLSSILVKGEISNFKDHYSSGHLYFTLKDENAAVRCVMFRANAARLKFIPEDGMAVICQAKADIYERDGQFQLYVSDIVPDGVGALALQFEQTKAKLEAEGMFDQKYKRPIPQFPKKIAVLTSDTGAALQDILQILSRRDPMAQIVLCPVTVQGADGAKSMINMLNRVYRLKDIDTVIIGRGGGSAEDLSCFNDETLARTVHMSPFPIISAVGHETDFTICDFVADLRAPTPSAAAELATVDIHDISLAVDGLASRIFDSFSAIIRERGERLDRLMHSRVFSGDGALFDGISQRLTFLTKSLTASFVTFTDKSSHALREAVVKLDSLSPLAVLARGYSLTFKDGESIEDIDKISVGDKLTIKFKNGTADAVVTGKTKG